MTTTSTQSHIGVHHPHSNGVVNTNEFPDFEDTVLTTINPFGNFQSYPINDELPNLNLYVGLLANVQCDRTYQNIPYFDNPFKQVFHYLRDCTTILRGELYGKDETTLENAGVTLFKCEPFDYTRGVIRIGIDALSYISYGNPHFQFHNINYLMMCFADYDDIQYRTKGYGYDNQIATMPIKAWETYRWIYAFVDDIKYISNKCIEVKYTIDVFQTYIMSGFFKFTPCFIERCHSKTDRYFENVLDEGLDVGDYHKILQKDIGESDLSVCMQATGKALVRAGSDFVDLRTPDPVESNNIYAPVTMYTHKLSTQEDLNEIATVINRYVENGYENSIVNFFMFPSWLTDKNGFWESGNEISNVYQEFNGTTVLDGGYVPKNKKLYNYPYNFLYVVNNNGQSATFHFEDFVSGVNNQRIIAPFNLRGAIYPTPSEILYPNGYKGTQECYDEGLVISNFPTCAFSGDVYKAWLAQNKNSISANILASTVGRNASLMTGATMVGLGTLGLASGVGTIAGAASIVGGVSSMASSYRGHENLLRSIEAKGKDLDNTPPQMHGQLQCEGLNAGLGRYKYSLFQMSAKREYLEIIDNYFTMFGYAQHTLGNVTDIIGNRPNFVYIKTQSSRVYKDPTFYVKNFTDGVLEGNWNYDNNFNVTPNEIATIQNVLDNGCTFWKNVGNYVCYGDTPEAEKPYSNGLIMGDYSVQNNPE